MGKEQQLPPVTSGLINSVPCPNCGKRNNFSGHHELVDVGHAFDCDHCGQPMQISGVRMVKLVSVRKPFAKVTRIKR